MMPILGVYDKKGNLLDSNALSDYNIFKYVNFRHIYRNDSEKVFRYIRFSPQKISKGELVGDMHLTIAQKRMLREFDDNFPLDFEDLTLEQESGHGLLFLVNRNREEIQDFLCAEGGAVMRIEEGKIYLEGESNALKGAKVYPINHEGIESELTYSWNQYKEWNKRLHKPTNPNEKKVAEKLLQELKENYWLFINPIYSIPALYLKKELNMSIFVPDADGKIIDFDLEKIIKKKPNPNE